MKKKDIGLKAQFINLPLQGDVKIGCLKPKVSHSLCRWVRIVWAFSPMK